MDQALVSLAERLLANKRQDRNERLRAQLRRRQQEAASAGRLGIGVYAADQREACGRELYERADEIWAAYRRVIADAGVAWSNELRAQLNQRVASELEADAVRIEEMARDVIVPHGHSFDLFMRPVCSQTLERIGAEIDLFGLRQRPIPSPVADQLAAPRYAGPAAHWRKADEFRRAETPDLASAAREAVNAVEGLAKIIAGLPDSTLGECIKALRTSGRLHAALAKQIEGLWGFVNTTPGFRHGAHTSATASDSELLFVLDSCDAAARLLLRLDCGAA
jgi:hypothetical protein